LSQSTWAALVAQFANNAAPRRRISLVAEAALICYLDEA